jgi:hypothetical protein
VYDNEQPCSNAGLFCLGYMTIFVNRRITVPKHLLMTKLIFAILTFILVNSLQAQVPTITSFSPASGSVGSLVTITGTNLNNPTALTIGGINALPISNTGTSLVVMVMPGAITGSIGITTAGGSASGSSNFNIVASLLPNTQQGNKLVGTGNIGAGEQGTSVAVSADGNIAIVGAYYDNNQQGAAWIYSYSGGVWTQQGSKLVGTDNIGSAQQGIAVSISADGNTAIVGGWWDDNQQGAVWIFIRIGGSWTQQGSKLVGTGVTGSFPARQGRSVSISADGNTVAVGGIYDNNLVGAVWVFTRTGNIWTQQGNKLVGTNGTSWQGFSVSISADGNTIIEGGINSSTGDGAAWVFTRSGGLWIQQGNRLVGTGGSADALQGFAVSIAGDGNTAIVAGRGDNSSQGAAWIFTRSGGVWTQQGTKLVGTSNIGAALQGQAVSISVDGNTAIVGGPFDNVHLGAIWMWKRSAGIWTQQGNKLVGTGNVGNAGLGISVSISADGNTVIAGGSSDNSAQGAAWVFKNASTLPVTLTSLHAFQKNTGIQVEWNTQTETNLFSYEVEKSSNGSTFTKAGTVTAKGLSTYNWFDASPINGSNYYRLKMMDKDGSFKYSSTVNVKIGSIKNVFTIAGNPIKNNKLVLQMENVEKGSYALSIYNNAGQLMMNRTIVHKGGSATQTVHLGNLSAGSYQLSIVGKDVKASKTVMVE